MALIECFSPEMLITNFVKPGELLIFPCDDGRRYYCEKFNINKSGIITLPMGDFDYENFRCFFNVEGIDVLKFTGMYIGSQSIISAAFVRYYGINKTTHMVANYGECYDTTSLTLHRFVTQSLPKTVNPLDVSSYDYVYLKQWSIPRSSASGDAVIIIEKA